MFDECRVGGGGVGEEAVGGDEAHDEFGGLVEGLPVGFAGECVDVSKKSLSVLFG